MDSLAVFQRWLKQSSFLTEEDCALFQPFLHIKKLSAKDLLLEQGQVCRELGFVIRGAFRTYYLSDGKEINTHFVFEHEFVVDYDSFIQEKPSRYYIQALEDAEIVTFNLEALQRAYEQSHNWERFGRIMAEQSYRITTERVESFLFYNGEQRYLNLVQTRPEVLNRIPLYHIASYLGLERESLSRLRKKIAREKRL